MTRFPLLLLVIALKVSRQFFNHYKAKAKPIAPGAPDFSRAFKLLGILIGFNASFSPNVIREFKI